MELHVFAAVAHEKVSVFLVMAPPLMKLTVFPAKDMHQTSTTATMFGGILPLLRTHHSVVLEKVGLDAVVVSVCVENVQRPV